MRLPNKLSLGARRDYLPPPKIGQHSVEILREIGLSDEAIDGMIAARVTTDGRIAGT